MIRTALMLGAFVLLAGLYGLLYSAGLLWNNSTLVVAGHVVYGVQCAVTVAILALTPLASGWKLLIVVSCGAYFYIPRVTWRYLQRTHEAEGRNNDR